MELKDYVKETLSQIAAGVEAAQTEVRDCGGFVNPANRVNPKNSDESHFGDINTGQNIFLVDFDVSVKVMEESGSDASAKLQVASFIKAGGGIEQSSSSSATNKISFKVPLALPVDSVTEEQLKEHEAKVREKRRQQNERINAHNRGTSWMSR